MIPSSASERKTLAEELDSLFQAVIARHEKGACHVTNVLDCAVRLVSTCARIKEEGLPEESFRLMSLVLNTLVKKAGVSVSEHATPAQKVTIILSSSLSHEEKLISQPIALCLEAHLEFQQNVEAQQLRDFYAGNNPITFIHPVTGKKIGPFDKKTLDLAHRTQAMMLLPEDKNKALREKLIRSSTHRLTIVDTKDAASLLKKRIFYMEEVAIVFKIQCEHWLLARRKRSLNVILAAHQKGFLEGWREHNIDLGRARKFMPAFNRVRHLLAAAHLLWWQLIAEQLIAEQQGADVDRTRRSQFVEFMISPARFFLAADRYRDLAKDAGLIKSKKELWMPEGWKELVQDVPPLEMGDIASGYDEEIRRLDAFEEEYKAGKEWQKA